MNQRHAFLSLAIPAAMLLAACDADAPDTARERTQSPATDQARTTPPARDVSPQASRDATPSTTPAPSASTSAPSMGEKTASALTDASVTAAVKAKLMKEPALSAMSIDVDTKSQGAVTLSGEVKSETAKQRAEELARATDGVRSVENKIVVRPA